MILDKHHIDKHHIKTIFLNLMVLRIIHAYAISTLNSIKKKNCIYTYMAQQVLSHQRVIH